MHYCAGITYYVTRVTRDVTREDWSEKKVESVGSFAAKNSRNP